MLTRLIRLDISKIPPQSEKTKRITEKSDYEGKYHITSRKVQYRNIQYNSKSAEMYKNGGVWF